MEAASAPQSFLSSIVRALEADPKWKFDFPPQPLFPKAGTVIVARKLLEDVVDAHRSPQSAAGQSPVIDVKAAYTLYETIAQVASLLADIINASSLSANRLPTEILSTIFSLVPRAYRHPSRTSDFPNRSSAFTRADDLQSITEVCRYWRQVALGTPSLWSTVAETPPTDSKVWCQAPFWRYYAHRCTDGPLYVDMNARGSDETIALVSRHRDRVRELSVTFNSERDLGDANYFVALSTPPFPTSNAARLHLLPLQAPPLNTPTTGVTSRFLPGSWRSLRCLALANVPFIPSNSFPSLTSFTFSLREPEPSWTLRWYAQDIWTNLLKLLSRCRALVTVTLDGMGVLRSDKQIITWAPFPDRIKLPNLKELALRDRCQWRDCGAGAYGRMYRSGSMRGNHRIDVPRAIHIPPTCRISIGVVHPLAVEELYAALLDLGSGRGHSIARVAFPEEVETGLTLLSMDTANLDSPEPDRIHVDLETAYSVPSRQDLTDRPTIWSLPFFARLRELWIDADAHAAFMRVGPASCALNLAELAQLETLVVRRASTTASAPLSDSASRDGPRLNRGWEDRPSLATARDLLKSLEPQAAGAADPTGNDIAGALACPCPFLATLRVDVIGSDGGVDDADADADEAGYVRGLAAGRAGVGCPISRLLMGVVFRDDVMVSPKAYVVSQYDAEGRLTGAGNHETDGLAKYWREGLSRM